MSLKRSIFIILLFVVHAKTVTHDIPDNNNFESTFFNTLEENDLYNKNIIFDNYRTTPTELIKDLSNKNSFNNLSIVDDEALNTESPLYKHIHTVRTAQHTIMRTQPRPWTIVIYMAADNDLRGFAARNIKQMATIGSNEFINILVQLDIRIGGTTGNKKITRRYFIEKNKIVHVNSEDSTSQQMDSGDPETLISCCAWATENYPSDYFGLVFWNHGTGIIDPTSGRITSSSELFTFNPSSHKFDLDRSTGFLDFINLKFKENEQRGICWDDSSGNYLTNQKLDHALEVIKTRHLNNRKIDLIGFDACLMSMLEVGNIVKKYATIMVGSQEVELGTGWNYERALSQFNSGAPLPTQLAQNIVTAYEGSYNKITNDYTQSALDLSGITALEENVHVVSRLLLEGLKLQRNNTVRNTVKMSCNKLLCTNFDEPSYKDLHHFYSNMLINLKHMTFIDEAQGSKLKRLLEEKLNQGRQLINKIVIANVSGKNLSQAKGISIYLPERKIHSSYRKTTFAESNDWVNFLNQYLLA